MVCERSPSRTPPEKDRPSNPAMQRTPDAISGYNELQAPSLRGAAGACKRAPLICSTLAVLNFLFGCGSREVIAGMNQRDLRSPRSLLAGEVVPSPNGSLRESVVVCQHLFDAAGGSSAGTFQNVGSHASRGVLLERPRLLPTSFSDRPRFPLEEPWITESRHRQMVLVGVC